MKNINLVKGMLALLVVQLVSVSTLFAADSAHLNSGNTRGVPIDKVDIHLVFSEQTDTSVKVTWLPVPTTTEYLMKIDGGADLNLGTATEYVITRTTPGIFTVKVAAWKIGGTNELLGESEVVQTTTVLKAPGYA
ncbi:MAG: hypothetical protein KAG98_02675, partial [Lentisphaeria bacterium]|nr:hypothetical protein [Lentisphaeria bacterium]